MTLAEKLRFLADRAEDGKEFYLGDTTIRLSNRSRWIYSDINFNVIDYRDIKLKPQWGFTEDEKVILRNLPDEYKWIARDQSNVLCTFVPKPFKKEGVWVRSTFRTKDVECLSVYNHLFKSIQWSDDEPCEFRKYL